MNINLLRIPASRINSKIAVYCRLYNATYCSCSSLLSGHNLEINNSKQWQNRIRSQGNSLKYSTDENKGAPSNKLPQLMSFGHITWPSIIKSLRNFILATFIIKPYFDKDFSLPEFVVASKTALEMVSQRISEGDLKALDGLATSEVISDVQQAISTMSMAQREQIAVIKDDIYFSFPYQVGIMFNDDEGQEQKRFVEITMVYHIMKGLAAMRSRGEDPPLNMGMVPEYQNRISICNYRFIREFTKGVEGDWTVNLLNHFKPIDLVENKE